MADQFVVELLETVTIHDGQGGSKVINKADFDPSRDVIFSAAAGHGIEAEAAAIAAAAPAKSAAAPAQTEVKPKRTRKPAAAPVQTEVKPKRTRKPKTAVTDEPTAN